LSETGCYADFTLPSIYSRAQVPRINAIYECGLPLSESRPHRKGPGLKVGRTPELPILITGPTILDWRAANRWPPFPRIDDGVLDSKYGLSMQRLGRWIRAGVWVGGRPDWLFIKLYGHAFFSGDQNVLVGEDARRFFSSMCAFAEETGQFKVHFATAREAFNIAMAAVHGWHGDPHDFRDFLLRPIMSGDCPRSPSDRYVGAGTVEAVGAGRFVGADTWTCDTDPGTVGLGRELEGTLAPSHAVRTRRLEPGTMSPAKSRILRSSEILRAMCEVLQSYPCGLPDTSLFALMEDELDLTAEDLEHCPSRPLLRRFELVAMRAAIAPIKAGWMVEKSDRWWLTSDGIAAFERYRDSEEFLRQAAGRSRKGWFSVFMPELYWFACSIKFRLMIELQLIRRVGLLHLFEKGLRIRTRWQKV